MNIERIKEILSSDINMDDIKDWILVKISRTGYSQKEVTFISILFILSLVLQMTLFLYSPGVETDKVLPRLSVNTISLPEVKIVYK